MEMHSGLKRGEVPKGKDTLAPTAKSTRSVMGNQAVLSELKERGCREETGGPPIQRKLDPVDLEAIDRLSANIPALAAVVPRLLAIYGSYPKKVTYGHSALGGQASLKDGLPDVVINDRASMFHRRFRGAGQLDTVDVDRQSKIIHELTHEEAIRVNAGGFGPGAHANAFPLGVGWEAAQPTIDALLEDINHLRQEPDLPVQEVEGLALLDYLNMRIEYAGGMSPLELPSVAHELIYFLNVMPQSRGQENHREQWQRITGSPLMAHLVELAAISFNGTMAAGGGIPMQRPD